MANLKEKLGELLKEQQEDLKAFLKENGEKKVADVMAGQIFTGARGIRALLCNTSSVNPDEGLRVRGTPIGDLTDKIPEEILYLLLTDSLPNEEELAEVKSILGERAQVPEYVFGVLDAMPEDSHPMCMLNTAILVQQRESVFSKRYAEGMPKTEYWDASFEDAMTLIARLPGVAAAVYRKRFNKGPRIDPDPNLDWGGNYAKMLGTDDPTGEFADLCRLYLVLHCDHGAGNVSACSAATVNSALSDLYYALSAGLNGLAGPLHGLANQECLIWIEETMKRFDGVPSVQQITDYAEETLAAKRVVPGYGHAVLRVTDPRFTAFMEFGKKHCPDDPTVKTVMNVFEAVPKVLQKYPKIKNPWPNVDAGSGSLLMHYGLTEKSYYTVLFSLSRALGICSQAVIARGIGQPIIRPSAVTTKWLKDAVK